MMTLEEIRKLMIKRYKDLEDSVDFNRKENRELGEAYFRHRKLEVAYLFVCLFNEDINNAK